GVRTIGDAARVRAAPAPDRGPAAPERPFAAPSGAHAGPLGAVDRRFGAHDSPPPAPSASFLPMTQGIASPPPARVGRALWITVAVVASWTLFGVLSSAHVFLAGARDDPASSFPDLLAHVTTFYWVWAALTP